MNELIIETHNLSKKYGPKLAVNQLNLAVAPGSIYGFLGPNGAGKTTTIRMLLNLIKPSQGEIKIFNRSLPQQRMEILRQVGSLVEAPSYYGHLSGYENLRIVARLTNTPAANIKDVLNLLGLGDNMQQLVKTYSLGMKQRLGLAMALLSRPQLLILDEPTNGLDPVGIREIRELIRKLPAVTGTTVFLSSHLLAEIEQTATHVGIMNQGRLLFQGTVEELKDHNKQVLQVKVNRPGEAAELLHRAGWKVKVNLRQEFLQVDAAEDDSAAIISLLSSGGFSVAQIFMQEDSLEDIFLQMIEQEPLKAGV